MLEPKVTKLRLLVQDIVGKLCMQLFLGTVLMVPILGLILVEYMWKSVVTRLVALNSFH